MSFLALNYLKINFLVRNHCEIDFQINDFIDSATNEYEFKSFIRTLKINGYDYKLSSKLFNPNVFKYTW